MGSEQDKKDKGVKPFNIDDATWEEFLAQPRTPHVECLDAKKLIF